MATPDASGGAGRASRGVAAGQDKTATVILKRGSAGRATVSVRRAERLRAPPSQRCIGGNGTGRRGGRALQSKLISKDRVEKTGRGSISVTAGGLGGACILGLIS